MATLALRGLTVPTSSVAKRLATAAVGIPLFVWGMTQAPAALFDGLVIALAAASAWELGRMLERSGRPTHARLGLTATGLVTASFMVPGAPAVALTVAVGLVLAASLAQEGPPSIEPATATLFAVSYVGWLLGHAILLRNLPEGVGLVLFLVGVTWAGESAAYAIGSAIGRHKLAPTISPGKTVEGSVAQLAVSLVAALLLAVWVLPAWSAVRALGAGLLLGVVGQIGDLSESVIKRSLKTKDTGGLIPGHGGVLDRLDSLLFNVPAFYYYVIVAGSRS